MCEIAKLPWIEIFLVGFYLIMKYKKGNERFYDICKFRYEGV